MKNNKIQWVLCLVISVLCQSNSFGQIVDSLCASYQIEVSAEPTTLYMDIYNVTDFGPYTPEVVEWYSPDWQIDFGNSATIVHELDVNFPPSFEMTICADYEVDGETCTTCEVVFVGDVETCEYELYIDTEGLSVFADVMNTIDYSPPTDVTWLLDFNTVIGNESSLFYEFDEPGYYVICAEYADTTLNCEGFICDTISVNIGNGYECDDIDLAFEITPNGGLFTVTHLLFYEIDDAAVEWYIDGQLTGNGNPLAYNDFSNYPFGAEVCAVVPSTNTNTGETCEGEICEWVDFNTCPEVDISYTPLDDFQGLFEAIVAAPFELDDMTWTVNGETMITDSINIYSLQGGHNIICVNGVAIDSFSYYPAVCPVDVCTEVYIPTDTLCNYELELLTEGTDVLAYVFNPDIPNSILLNVEWVVDGGNHTIIYTEGAVVIQFETSGAYTVCATYYDPMTGCEGTLCNEVIITIDNTNNCEGFDFEYSIEGDWALFELFYPDVYEVNDDSIAWYVNGQFIEHVGLFDYNFPNLGYNYDVCAVVAAFHLPTETWCEIEVCHQVPIYCPTPMIGYKPINDSMFVFNASIAAPYQLGDVSWYINNNDFAEGNPLTYVFPESGTYEVCLVASVSDQDGNWLCAFEGNCIALTVEIDNPPNCEASFEWEDNGNVNGVNSVIFANTSAGNYTDASWDFGDGNTSNHSDGDSFEHIYENTGVYNVCLTVWDPTGCQSTHCELVLVSGTPNAECDYEIDYEVFNNDIYYFALNSSSGISGNPEWFNLTTGEVYGTGDSLLIVLSDYGVYEICASYETVGNTCWGTVCTTVTINNPICEDTDCVFPGDTDYNMLVDNYDVLPLGLHFGETGPARPDATIDWYGQPAPDWQAATDSINLKHSDCNGDGEIFFDDIDAIEQNYNRTHDGVNAMKQTDGAPGLHLEFDLDTIYSTPDTGTIMIYADIIMGTIDLPVDELYGVAFSVGYPADLVDSSSVAAGYFTGSWMGDPTMILQLEKTVTNESVIDFAYSRTDLQNISGFGQIGTASFVMTDNIIGKLAAKTELNFPITNIRAIDNAGTEVILSGSNNVIVVDLGNETTATDNPDLSQNIKIFPNPTSNTINMTISDLQAHTLTLYNPLGQRVLARQVVGTNTQIDVSQLPTGIYIVSVQTDQGTHNQKIIIE